jgi:hypothetical protein
MKAKKIFEKFSEESDPIADIGIGGFKLDAEFERRRKKLETDTKKLIERSNVSWGRYLYKLLVGKTITAQMNKLAAFDSKTMEQKYKNEGGKFTITVKDLHVETIEHEYNKQMILAGEDDRIYRLSFSEKIYINK